MARKGEKGYPTRREAPAGQPPREVVTRVLVVAEGTNTEPQYLEQFAKIAEADFGVQIVPRPKNSEKRQSHWRINPVSVVSKCVELRDEDLKKNRPAPDQAPDVEPFARCFAVVDVDKWDTGRHPTQLERAIELASKEGIDIVITNLKFEAWLLWHAEKPPRPNTDGEKLDKQCEKAGFTIGKNMSPKFPYRRYPEAERQALQVARVPLGKKGPNPSSAMPALLAALRALK